jgi:hypothetical protein
VRSIAREASAPPAATFKSDYRISANGGDFIGKLRTVGEGLLESNPRMHLAHPILVALVIILGAASLVTSNVIFYQILNEVNSRRPLEQQFSFIFAGARAFEVAREHARLFPGSDKRKLMFAWAGTGFALFLAALLLGSQVTVYP